MTRRNEGIRALIIVLYSSTVYHEIVSGCHNDKMKIDVKIDTIDTKCGSDRSSRAEVLFPFQIVFNRSNERIAFVNLDV